jgi:dUTP pyrophosphatase
MQIKIEKLTPNAKMPTYGSEGAAAFDIYADIYEHTTVVAPGSSCLVGTGLAIEVPPGHVLRVYSRSGHGFNWGVSLVNSVGIIDSDYRGELKIGLRNDGDATFVIDHGDRIAQGIVEPVERVEFVEVGELSATARGTGGFGSTGK